MSDAESKTLSPTIRATGQGFSVKLRMGGNQRRWFKLASRNERDALVRKDKLESLARLLVKAGRGDDAAIILRDAAQATSAEAFARIERTARYVCSQPKRKRAETKAALVTFRDVAEYWLSGELEAQFPDHVRKKGAHSMAQSRGLMRHLYQTIGHVAVREFTLDDAERAKQALPKRIGSAQRRAYCRHVRTVLERAVYPLRLIAHNPVPASFIPKAPKRSEFAFLYPDEDRLLLLCDAIEWWERLLYGLLDREGCRVSEAQGAVWGDVDLVRGSFVLDKNKTRSPRTWKLRADVVRALEAWRERLAPASSPKDRIFPGLDTAHIAKRFREQLIMAGVNRRELFTKTSERRPVRVHDLRATFITLSLASGATETWVMDRTGHTTSLQLNQYRRNARHAAELELGALGALDELLGVSARDEVPPPARRGSKSVLPTVRGSEHVGASSVVHGVVHGEQFSSKTAAEQTCSWTASSDTTEHEQPKKPAARSKNPTRKRCGPPEIGGVVHDNNGGGPRELPGDAVETALATALEGATAASQWDVVATLAQELSERRRTREQARASNVTSIASARAKREGK